MGRLDGFTAMVAKSRLLAPNLRSMTLTVWSGNAHGGNAVARELVRKHLLALRWSNPNAVVRLAQVVGQGRPTVEYELWSGQRKSFEVAARLSPEEVVAKVMMAARDPDDDEPLASGAAAGSAAAVAGAAAAAAPIARDDSAKAAVAAAAAAAAARDAAADVGSGAAAAAAAARREPLRGGGGPA